jgi:hypothetical protein
MAAALAASRGEGLRAEQLLGVLQRNNCLTSCATFIDVSAVEDAPPGPWPMPVAALSEADASMQEAEALVRSLDLDRDGALGFEDLQAALFPRVALLHSLPAVFAELDADSDGYVGLLDIVSTLWARERAVATGRAGAGLTTSLPMPLAALCAVRPVGVLRAAASALWHLSAAEDASSEDGSSYRSAAYPPATLEAASPSYVAVAKLILAEAAGLCQGQSVASPAAPSPALSFSDFVRLVASDVDHPHM